MAAFVSESNVEANFSALFFRPVRPRPDRLIIKLIFFVFGLSLYDVNPSSFVPVFKRVPEACVVNQYVCIAVAIEIAGGAHICSKSNALFVFLCVEVSC